MDYTTFTQTMDHAKLSAEVDADSLYAAFERVTDGRKKRGVRYPLALLLTLIVLAKLAGETSLSGAAHWVRLRKEELRAALHVTGTRFPCAATYSYALSRVDAEELTSVIAHFFTRREASKRCGTEPSRLLMQKGAEEKAHVALDGKTLRGTLKHESAHQGPVHLLSLYETKTGIVLAQHQVQVKENEISAVKDWLVPVYLKGRIISADAMHTQRTFCATCHRAQGYYLLIAKDNQPTTHTDLQLYFEDPQADRSGWQSARTCEKGHGRLEIRQLTTSCDLNTYFERMWAGLAQVFRLERRVTRSGQSSLEVVYGLTNLPPKLAGPPRLMQLVRAHWGIENRLHYRRDVTLGEDACQVRNGQAPQALAALNNAVLALADCLKIANLKAQMRIYDAHPEQALALLLSSDF